MIPIVYFRSSSYGSHEFCNHQYFLQYVLGLEQKVSIRTDMGTIVHKVMELYAEATSGKEYLDFDGEKLCRKRMLADTDYYFTTRKIYDYYRLKFSSQNWTDEHFNECLKWVRMAMKFNDGEFDPRNRKIIASEQGFDLPIESSWAKLDKGFLSIKGTIDLVTESNGCLEVIDWKTGARKDWGKNIPKDYKYLTNDSQLRIYHWAISQLYPDYDTILMTIFFIRDGGPYTVPFTKKDLVVTEGLIRKKFELIQQTIVPKMNEGWHCTKFCHYGKHDINGNKVNDKSLSMCNQIHREIQAYGTDKVIETRTKDGYSLNKYKAPG